LKSWRIERLCHSQRMRRGGPVVIDVWLNCHALARAAVRREPSPMGSIWPAPSPPCQSSAHGHAPGAQTFPTRCRPSQKRCAATELIAIAFLMPRRCREPASFPTRNTLVYRPIVFHPKSRACAVWLPDLSRDAGNETHADIGAVIGRCNFGLGLEP